MNDKLKAILGIALSGVAIAVPGAAAGVAVGQKILLSDDPLKAAKDHGTQLDAVQAAFQVVENLKGVDIGNEVMFRVGCAQVEQGLATIEAALKDHGDQTPTA
jgi:hypothetical protein